MAIKPRLEIKKTPTSRGTYPVYIRISKDRKLKRIKTSVELKHLSDWNPKGKDDSHIRTSEKNSADWNDKLKKELRKISDICDQDSTLSLDAIAHKFKGEESGTTTSFFKYAQFVASDLKKRGATNYKHYESFCRKLQGFIDSTGRTDITFSDLNPALLEAFETHLRSCVNSNHKDNDSRLNPNYIKAVLIKFRAIVNRAIKQGLFSLDKYPFKNYTLPKEVAVNREALNEAEIQAIIQLKLPEESRLLDTRNCFLFSFYCAGIRAGDLLQLRWNNITDEGTRLHYVMAKTQKVRNFQLMPQARQILEYYRKEDSKPTDYIFPFLDSSAKYAKYPDAFVMPVDQKDILYKAISSKNSQLNNKLRQLADLAGIKKHLSFHISRHSFASIAKSKDISSKIVQEALAHSSLTITERYMHNFTSNEMDSALKKVYNVNTGSKEETLLNALKELDEDSLARVLEKLKSSK